MDKFGGFSVLGSLLWHSREHGASEQVGSSSDFFGDSRQVVAHDACGTKTKIEQVLQIGLLKFQKSDLS